MNMFDLWLNRRFMSGKKAEKDYIEFADPVVEQICANTWGDGTGLTYAQAARVTSLSNAFRGNTNIVSFDELKYFTGLTTLIGGATNTLGQFNGCTGLKSIVLPPNLTTIQDNVFRGCSALESVTSESSTLFSVGSSAFLGNTALKTFPFNLVTGIGGSAFYGTESLTIALNVPNLTSLGQGSFRESGITSITSLGTVATIPGSNTTTTGCFYSCTGLTSVVLPSTVTTIQTNAFRGCSALTTINLPTTLTTVGGSAFYGCSSLAIEVNLPNLTSTGASTFYGCAEITKVKSLGSTITTFPATYLRSCTSLTEAVIPATVTSIGNEAFRYCSSLATLVCLATTPPTWGTRPFNNTPTGFSIYVPYSADHSILAAYKAASGWSGRASYIFELDENGNIPT